jgi:hypothetical protein
VFAEIPVNFPNNCFEKYMALAPLISASATPAPFTPRDLFVTDGNNLWRVSQGNIQLFSTISGCAVDHTGITFDHSPEGFFGNNIILSCENGGIWKVDGNGTSTFIATVNGEAEGPAVVPSFFGPFGGQVWVADEINGQVHAISNTGVVTHNILPFFFGGVEAVNVVPFTPCTFCSGGAFFQAITNFATVYQYLPGDFVGLGGTVILTSEEGYGSIGVYFDGVKYQQFFFDNIVGGGYEGSSFVDCDVPTPTPTPTATFTPTPTATFTPTSTATFTPTATSTATFTPTSTATFTPTSTATFTPTSTATFTPTATATATSTPTATATPTFTPCGALGSCTPPYPFTSGNARTSIAFNESTVLRAFRVTTTADGCTPLTLNMFYNDEHALTLGVRQTQVKTCAGITVTGVCNVSPMTMHPADHVHNPDTGCTEAAGGVDPSGRPMAPVVFVTDLDTYPGNTNELAGDWQFGGTGIPPDDVFGTWKAAVSTLDTTVTPNVITVTPDADPVVNNWNLDGMPPCPGPNCPDPVPTPTPANEGYGAEVRWDISSLHLTPGHRYRLYFIVHDGDQNKTGGDSGQACVYLTMPGSSPTPSPTPTASPTATPTATPFALPAGIIVGTKALSGKNVAVSFFNNTGAPQQLTGLSITWPQATNGNLKTIKLGGTTIYNTITGGGSLSTDSLLGTAAQRTIAAGACGTVTFGFTNNVDTNPADYTGSLRFTPYNPGGVPPVQILP